MIDEGEKNYQNLPLFGFFQWYYGRRPKERLEFEAKILGLKNVNVKDITYNWVKRHVNLYKSIKSEGYLPERRKKPILVNITDSGDIKVKDGNHTVSILKHLKYKGSLHVKVDSRSQGWIDFKDKLYKLYGRKLLYQPLDHPDFCDWEIDRECVNRWRIINEAVDFKDKNVLDVGSCTGWCSLHCAMEGARVVGVEPNAVRVEAAGKFAAFHGFHSSNPIFVKSTFEKYLGRYKNTKFDVVLMLSLLHHYIRRNPDEAWSAVNLLSRCSRSMVLELGLNDLPIEWSPELILENSHYIKYKTLYEGERPIYLFTV